MDCIPQRYLQTIFIGEEMKDWTNNHKLVTVYAILSERIVQKGLLYSAIFYTGFVTHMYLF
jgi:hypothetical protein